MAWWKKWWNNPGLQHFFEIAKQLFTDSDISMTSIVAAYYFLLSLFPLLIAVGNVLPYLNINPSLALTYLKQLLPNDIFQMLQGVIRELLTKRSGGLLSISALVTLWTASQGVNALQSGINRAYGVDKSRNFIQNRIFGFLVTILLVTVLVVAAIVIGFGQNLMNWIREFFNIDAKILENVHTWTLVGSILGIFLLLVVLYEVTPNVVITQKKYLLPGAFLATAGLLFLSKIFGWYAKYFTTKVSEYQLIGSVIVLMYWLVFSARILIIGSIVNLVLLEYVTGQKLAPKTPKIHLWLKGKMEKIREKLKKFEK